MPKPNTFTFDEISVGDRAEFIAEITPELVSQFADFSGDHSPLHVNDEYAATTSFGTRIPHGMIASAFFSRLVGMELPGVYAVYLGQTITFHKPLPLSGSVRVKGEVIQRSDATHMITLSTQVLDPKTSDILVRGEARVRVLK